MTSEQLNEYEQSQKNYRNNMYTVEKMVKDYQKEIAIMQRKLLNTIAAKDHTIAAKDIAIADLQRKLAELGAKNDLN